MRNASRVLAVALLVAVLGAASAHGSFIVETYTGIATIRATLPGSQGSGSTSYPYTFKFDSIDFAPGAVIFQGQPVDFDGTEPQWIGSTESGTMSAPILAGPATTGVTITGAWSGPVTINGLSGTANSVDFGPSFGPSNLDGVPGSTYDLNHTYGPVISPPNLIPPGSSLSHQGKQLVNNIDGLNGIVHLAAEGVFLLQDPVSTEATSWSRVKLIFGGSLLLSGLVGGGLLAGRNGI